VAFHFPITDGWIDWLSAWLYPDVLLALIGQFLPFLFLPPLLIAAACLWRKHRSAAKVFLKTALVAFLIGIVWEMLIL
jgi:hypothetical protein